MGVPLSEYERWETRYAKPDYTNSARRRMSFSPAARRCCRNPAARCRSPTARAATASGSPSRGSTSSSIDFSPTAQRKARALAAERKVSVEIIQTDVHAWPYPEAAFDVVVEIFAQFSTPTERAVKWAGMRRALKPGGLLIVQGYTPKQLDYATGGPKQIEHLYTRALLEQAFGDFRDVKFTEEEREMHEGAAHSGMSAVIGLTARKP